MCACILNSTVDIVALNLLNTDTRHLSVPSRSLARLLFQSLCIQYFLFRSNIKAVESRSYGSGIVREIIGSQN